MSSNTSTDDKIDSIALKNKELFEDRINRQHEELVRRKEEYKKIQSIDLGKKNIDRINKIKNNNTEYLTLAKTAKTFINNDFKGVVPYFARNLILITADTGSGKSTISANLAYHAIKQGQKVLILTNEENTSDVYNRVTCLIKGWAYNNHENFTDKQIEIFNKYIEILHERMIVVDDGYNDSTGVTTTIEGVQSIMDSLIKNKSDFDLIVIDYYQNVYRSVNNPKLENWKVQELFANYLDVFKNKFAAPVVVLAQKKPNDKEATSYKDLIEGRKVIANKATCIIEIIAERELLRTKWKVMKSRFINSVGSSIITGFKKGKYVPYTKEFSNEVLAKKEMEQTKKILSGINKSDDDEKNKHD